MEKLHDSACCCEAPEECACPCNQEPPAASESELAQLRKFMDDEASDMETYRVLGARFCCPRVRKIMLELSRDEECHLKKLRAMYFLKSGCAYKCCPEKVCIGSLVSAVRERYAEETEGAQAYEAAAACEKDDLLRCLYTELAGDERRHAEKMYCLAFDLTK